MIFTQKKFHLIGARARIKKIFHLLEDVIPTFQTPGDLDIIPLYLEYLITLNPEARSFQFSEEEIERLKQFKQVLRQPFSPEDRRDMAQQLLKLRHLLAAKIQQPLKEGSLIILERDVPRPEPLIWPAEVLVVLDHLRSPYNVGAILRTMECVGLRRVISLGYTPRLDSKQVKRSAMGCEALIQVEYEQDGVAALKRLQAQGFQMYALETIVPSTSVFDLALVLPSQETPLALVVGNEEFGVDESLLGMADHLIHIPTFGTKNSLNVSIAFSVAIYQFWAAIFGKK
ncbi:putative tRNA/rRNA methyltransferase [Candidatus Vecturithrix granuli]|uniref:Putative tRNA/rRNA methyltransferase n=1 Tax=Vecturithrix granuli TaxID=1499967 RepID=A0A081C9J4_VECG1|nr:putative tRNA/rRNA methyltransferase [Candidatus Vecturithrix granuli]